MARAIYATVRCGCSETNSHCQRDQAPRNDLNLLRSLSIYPVGDTTKAAITAVIRHLWYLSEDLIGFCFFDEDVSIEENKMMVVALKEKDGLDEPLKPIPPFLEPMAKQLRDFVTNQQDVSLGSQTVGRFSGNRSK